MKPKIPKSVRRALKKMDTLLKNTRQFFCSRKKILLIFLAVIVVMFLVCFCIELKQRMANPGEVVKIGFSTDWEYGSRKKIQMKLTNQAPAELEKVVNYFNEVFHPDLVIGGGDYIESSGVKVYRAKIQLGEINDIFKRVAAPRAYVLGNHDMRVLTKEEVMDILGIAENHGIYDMGAWRVVLFDTNFNKNDDSDRGGHPYSIGYVSNAELDWLDQSLMTDRPTIVFSHHTPVQTLTVDDIWRENIENADMVRAVLEKHPNVVASVSGHTPRPQSSVVNGITYFVGDTLVSETGLGAFATLELRYNPFSTYVQVIFEHYGMHRETYTTESYMEKDLVRRYYRMIKQFVSEG